MEEFGVTDTQEATYTVWWNTVISSGLAGDLIWLAGSDLSNGDTPNDGYAVSDPAQCFSKFVQFSYEAQ
jgi:mannan endo-1,4-beta-mannosidase